MAYRFSFGDPKLAALSLSANASEQTGVYLTLFGEATACELHNWMNAELKSVFNRESAGEIRRVEVVERSYDTYSESP